MVVVLMDKLDDLDVQLKRMRGRRATRAIGGRPTGHEARDTARFRVCGFIGTCAQRLSAGLAARFTRLAGRMSREVWVLGVSQISIFYVILLELSRA